MTGKVPLRSVAALMLAASCTVAASDLDDYIESARKSRTSENAAQSLSQVAEILSGRMVFKPRRDPAGWLLRVYGTPGCFVPTSDPKLLAKQRSLQAERDSRYESWVALLKTAADSDHSGFVSSAEGSALLLGFEAALASAQLGISNRADLASSFYATPEKLEAAVTVYASVRLQAISVALPGMPDLPDPPAWAGQ